PAASNNVLVWNLVDEQWYRPSITAIAGSTIPLPQKFAPCVEFPTGKMFVLIANTTDQTKNAAVLDVTQWSWQEITTSSTPSDFRIGVTLTAANDSIYRYAGRALDVQGNQAQTTNNLLDPNTLLWTPRASGPSLAYHTACYLSKFDVIAVFGGQNSDFQVQDVFVTYSISQDVWHQLDQPMSNKP
ncbi:1169_t:CDS:2, partial [Paraglomus occultum]